MADITQSLILNLAGNIDQRSHQYSQSIGRFAQTGQRHLAGLKRGFDTLGRGVDALGNRYTAIVSGAATAAALRNTLSLDARLKRLQTDGEASADAIERLKNQIFEVANAPDIRVDPKQILSAVEEIVEMTGDIQFAVDNVRNIGLAIQAAGAEGADVGAFMSELQKKGIRDAEAVLRVVDALVKQGKAGAFTFSNTARLGSRLFTAYKKQGADAVREVGALAQVARQAAGSSEQATTAVEALFRTLGDVQKVKDIESEIGVQVRLRDDKGNVIKGIRNVTDILVELIEKTGGDEFILSSIFDAEAMRVFNGLLIEGNVELLKRLRTIEATGETLRQDARENASTAQAALRSIFTTMEKLADRKLTGPVQEFADTLNEISPERLDAIAERLFKVAAGLGAFIVGFKVIRGVGSLLGRGGQAAQPGGGLAGGLAGAAGSMTPVPVFVVNNLPGMGGVAGGAAAGAGGYRSTLGGYGARGSRLSRTLSGAGRLAGRLATPLALLTSGVALTSTLMDSSRSATAKIVDSSGILGGVGGGLGGAKLGALIGTAIAPGIGTAIGAALGGAGGFLAGQFAGRGAASWLTAEDIGRETAKALKGHDVLTGSVSITVDGNGNVRPSRVQRSGGSMDIEVDSGRIMSGVLG